MNENMSKTKQRVRSRVQEGINLVIYLNMQETQTIWYGTTVFITFIIAIHTAIVVVVIAIGVVAVAWRHLPTSTAQSGEKKVYDEST